jgi:hypothetical protein
MAQIHGQVESLKRLKRELESNGINRFKSIKEINDFLKNFQKEKKAIIDNQRESLNNEIENLNLKIKENQEKSEILKSRTIGEIDFKIESVKRKIEALKAKANRSILHKILFSFCLIQQKNKLNYYNAKYSVIVYESVKSIREIIRIDGIKINYFINNKELIINKRSSPEIQRLEYIKRTIDNLHLLIAGAIGENLVVKEIEKLSNDFILINDYNLKFNPPIYNRKSKDRIFSIQIDHLLISRSGVYILETKNWSKISVESLDLRSPVEQITRTGYALFVLVNDAEIRLTEHHWGGKQIPIKSIIVMINEKPNEDFKYVKVKSLKELNNYLTYFEPVFSKKEVDIIVKYLIEKQNYS